MLTWQNIRYNGTEAYVTPTMPTIIATCGMRRPSKTWHGTAFDVSSPGERQTGCMLEGWVDVLTRYRA